MKYHTILLLISFVFFAVSAHATEQSRMSSGTGFFVSRKGEIVTNAHVVQQCIDAERVFYRIGSARPQMATIIDMDEENDLALLDTGQRASTIASLRWMHTKIEENHNVLLLGYPEATSISSPYSKAYATIKALEGPQGEKKWLQFTDAARHGNSGGPLLDFGGNVVGVVTAKTVLKKHDVASARESIVGQSDVAVTTETLKRFLDLNRVSYVQADSVLELGQRRLERLASGYVAHVFCEVEG
jgi:S1-C subfamily serine protease